MECSLLVQPDCYVTSPIETNQAYQISHGQGSSREIQGTGEKIQFKGFQGLSVINQLRS